MSKICGVWLDAAEELAMSKKRTGTQLKPLLHWDNWPWLVGAGKLSGIMKRPAIWRGDLGGVSSGPV